MKRSQFLKSMAIMPFAGMFLSELSAQPPCKLVFTGTPEEKFKQYLDHFTKNGKEWHILKMYIASASSKEMVTFDCFPVVFRMHNGVYVTDMWDDKYPMVIFGNSELTEVQINYFTRMSWENGEEYLGYPYQENSFVKHYPGLEEWIHLTPEQKILANNQNFKIRDVNYNSNNKG